MVETMTLPIKENQIRRLLDAVTDKRPALKEWLNRYGNQSLRQYSESTNADNNAIPIQPREDIGEVVHALSAPILGETRAAKLSRRLIDSPTVITANHHHPDYFGLTRQGVGTFALSGVKGNDVLVFACGAVPQKNLSWPRGILLAREHEIKDETNNMQTKSIPIRINIFPDKDTERLVSVSPSYTPDMVEKAQKSVDSLRKSGILSEAEAITLNNILKEYLNPKIIHLPTYSDQITALNDKLWNQQFASEVQDQIPGVAYLELERVVAGILEKDLTDKDSLAYRILFDRNLREKIIQELNGVEGCWKVSKLNAIIDNDNPLETQERVRMMDGAGTMFFSGIDQKGRRVPLNLTETSSNAYLKGVDKSGNELQLSFTPEDLVEGLRTKKILPSVFTDFVVLAFARGMKCYGGFNQINYLPHMKAGLVRALKGSNYLSWADRIKDVPTDALIMGLISIVATYRQNVKPAGGVEILTKPITVADLEKMKRLTVREAFMFGLPGMYKALFSEVARNPELMQITENDIYDVVGNKYVIINIDKK